MDKLEFSNQENSNLEEKLQLKRKYLEKLREFCREQDEQILNLEDHEQNLLKNIDYNHEILQSTQKEIDSEKALIKIKLNEKHYLDKQTEKMKVEIEEFEKNGVALEKWLIGQKRKLDDLQEAVVWETDSWQEWLQRAYANEKTNFTISKMLGQDSTLIKELGLKLEKINLEVTNWKKLRDDAFNDQLVFQMELKRNTHEFSNAHEDRRNILKRWDESVQEMERRDARLVSYGKEMKLIEDRVETLNRVSQMKKDHLNEKLEVKANIQSQLELLNSAMMDLKHSLSQYGPESQLENELDALKNQVKNLSMDERNLRSAIFKTREETIKRNQILSDLKDRFKTMEKEYASLGQKSMSVELRLNMSKSMMLQEEKFIEKMDKNLHKLKEDLSNQQRKSKLLREKYRTVGNFLQSAYATARELSSQMNKIDAKTENIENTLNELNLKENDLEEIYELIKGTVQRSTTEIDQKLLNELKSIREIRDEKFRHSQCLSSNLYRTLDEIKKYAAELDEVKLDQKVREDETNNLDKNIEFAQATFNRDTNKKQEMMVESCLLQVSVRRLQISVEQLTDFIGKTDLEIMETQNAIQEKLSLMEQFRNTFKLQRNRLSEEKQLSAVNLQKCLTKLKASEARYDILRKGNLETATDPEMMILKAEKEKQSLESQDRDIEDLITKTDQEIQALRNSLEMLEKSNSEIRNKIKPPTNEVKSQVVELENKLQLLYNDLYEKQRELKHLQNEVKELNLTLQKLQTEHNDDEINLKEVLQKVDFLTQHLAEHEIKLRRADNQINKILTDKKNAPSDSVINDISLKILTELKSKVDKNVKEILSVYPETHVYFSCESKPTQTYTKDNNN